MIEDNQTNFLYLADTLPKKYPDLYKRVEKLLLKSKVMFSLLPHTKYLWSVDYMLFKLV